MEHPSSSSTKPLAGAFIWGIVAIAFVLPFERIGALEFSGLTVRASQVLLMLTAGGWFVKNLLQKRFHLAPYPIGIFVGIFLFGSLLSLLNAPNPEYAIMVLLFTVFTMVLSFLVPQLVLTRHDVSRVVYGLLWGAVLVSLFGLFQFLGDVAGLPVTITGLREHYTKAVLGFPRIQSTTLEPLYFANYLLLPIALTLSLLLSRTSRRAPFWTIVLVLFGLNFVLTISRGGYLAMIPVLMIIGVYYLRRIVRPKILIVATVMILIVAFGASRFLQLSEGINQFNIETFSGHVSNVFSGASFEERAYTFEEAMKLWREHPVLGIGPGSFGPSVASHPYQKPSGGWAIVNNETIELITETGIIGTLSMLFLFVVLFARGIKSLRATHDPKLRAVVIALLATLMGYLVQYQTFSTLYIMHIWFTMGFLIAVQNVILLNHAKKLS